VLVGLHGRIGLARFNLIGCFYQDHLRAKNVDFRIKPNVKDHPDIGTVGNMFVADPAGNYLEFKSYKDKTKIL
jgi:extradiol dioxygenase family protein